MTQTSKISIFSFFSGIGLLDLGFEDEGYKICYVNEFHEPFLRAYEQSRQDLKRVPPKYGFDNRSIENLLKKEAIQMLNNHVEQERKIGNRVMFIGGPPCPDFSIGGKNLGATGENGKLTATYFKLIKKLKPDIFLFENVRGLFRTQKHRSFFDGEVHDLKKTGYLLKYDLYNSLQFGVGQDRFRLICIGALKAAISQESFDSFDLKNQVKFDLNLYLKSNRKQNQPLLFDFKLPEELTVEHWFAKNEVTSHPNSRHFFIPRAAFTKFKTITEGDSSKKSFKRLHRKNYSPTAAYGNNEVHIHPTEPRRISAAEALSIQSAPRNFILPNDMTLTNMFKSIGNAVPYLMARAIAKESKKLNS